MTGLFLRLLVAAITVVALLLIIPAFLRLVGFPANGDLELIIKVTLAALAVLYVLRGPTPSWPA